MDDNIPLNIVVIILCCAALWKGACWLVEAAARLAKWLGVSELVIGVHGPVAEHILLWE